MSTPQDNRAPEGNPHGKKKGMLVRFFLAAALGAGLILGARQAQKEPPPKEVPYSQFMKEAPTGSITNVVIQGRDITGQYKDGQSFKTRAPVNENVIERLDVNKTSFTDTPPEEPSFFVTLLLGMLPIIIVLGGIIYIMSRYTRGNNGIGASLAKRHTGSTVTFKDVAGIDAVKDDLKEIVSYLKKPERYADMNLRVPRGFLLVGPPGTGKTLIAKAVAGEAGVPFFTVAGSEFTEMFVGRGAARVRDMFEKAKKDAPCIIFIDEIDSVGGKRGNGNYGHSELEQTLNQLLVELDGFVSRDGVIILAATNRPDMLDEALLRPGRFDRQISVPLPDLKGREDILKVHCRDKKLAADVDLREIARGTYSFSGADLANLVNEAGLVALHKDRQILHKQDFEQAKDKVIYGTERRTLVMSPEERKLTAWHEAGHALVSTLLSQHLDPIYKATIVPRGQALGAVISLPDSDRVSRSRVRLKAELAMIMAGRVAEERLRGPEGVTTGAQSDIDVATRIASAMVRDWGLSDKVGMRRIPSGAEGPYGQKISPDLERLVDSEINAILSEAHDKAKDLLAKHVDKLEAIALALLEYETLEGAEIKAIVEGRPLNRQPLQPPPPPALQAPAVA